MKTKKALLCLGAAATLLLYGCESEGNSDNLTSETSQSESVSVKITKKVIPAVKTPSYTKPKFSPPSTRSVDSLRKEYHNKLKDSLIKGGMDEETADEFLNGSEKSKEESTRTTLSQEEMRKKYLGE